MSGLRSTMPTVAAFVDDLREAFGADLVNAQIRAGMKGEPAFYAEEGGAQLGTKEQAVGCAVSVADMVFWQDRQRGKK